MKSGVVSDEGLDVRGEAESCCYVCGLGGMVGEVCLTVFVLIEDEGFTEVVVHEVGEECFLFGGGQQGEGEEPSGEPSGRLDDGVLSDVKEGGGEVCSLMAVMEDAGVALRSESCKDVSDRGGKVRGGGGIGSTK